VCVCGKPKKRETCSKYPEFVQKSRVEQKLDGKRKWVKGKILKMKKQGKEGSGLNGGESEQACERNDLTRGGG
jgi:hypothetical protein